MFHQFFKQHAQIARLDIPEEYGLIKPELL